jgi:hypothetical protein
MKVAAGILSVEFSGSSPKVSFSGVAPVVTFDGSSPKVSFSGIVPTVTFDGARPTVGFTLDVTFGDAWGGLDTWGDGDTWGGI